VAEDLALRAPLFAGLSRQSSMVLVDQMAPTRLIRGEELFTETEPGERLYVVRTGKMKLVRRSADGRENLLSVVGPGEMLGELSLFDPGPRTSSAVALTSTVVLELDRDQLIGWLNAHPSIAVPLLQALARRLRRTSEARAEMVFTDVAGRVARALLDLADRFGEPIDGGVHVAHDLTQVELAQLVGASRETVNKSLGEFAQRGWLVREPRAVLLVDVERLEHRAR